MPCICHSNKGWPWVLQQLGAWRTCVHAHKYAHPITYCSLQIYREWRGRYLRIYTHTHTHTRLYTAASWVLRELPAWHARTHGWFQVGACWPPRGTQGLQGWFTNTSTDPCVCVCVHTRRHASTCTMGTHGCMVGAHELCTCMCTCTNRLCMHISALHSRQGAVGVRLSMFNHIKIHIHMYTYISLKYQ